MSSSETACRGSVDVRHRGCVVGCATGKVRPGTGDISFRLPWTGASDLDLHVKSPLGERIDFVRSRAASGGVLDVDCSVQSVIETNLCSEPLENIFWPAGMAPEGECRYWPIIADPRDVREEDVYKIEVRMGKEIVTEHVGLVVDLRTEPPISTISCSRNP